MRSTPLKGIFLILAISFLTHTASASNPALPRIESSLPPENLARYNDSFDTLREDI
ncbi:MAG: hypothetical protein ABIG67_05905 [Pseudomonadota bacterium]